MHLQNNHMRYQLATCHLLDCLFKLLISDYAIKTIHLANVGEFTSQVFNDYCMSIGIKAEHPLAHVHTQNDLAELFIKCLQLIAKPLLMRTKLSIST